MKAKKLLSGLLTCAIVATSVFNGGLVTEVKAEEASSLPNAIESYDFNSQTLSDNSVGGGVATMIQQGLGNGKDIAPSMGAEYNGEAQFAAGRSEEQGDYSLNLAKTYGLLLDSKGVGEDWALSTWVNPTTASGNGPSVFVGHHTPEQWMSISGGWNGIVWRLWITSQEVRYDQSADAYFKNGQWNHVVYSQKGDTLNVFVNGDCVYTSDAAPALLDAETDRIMIGANYWGDAYFDGYVDDIKVYDQALTGANVLELYGSDETVEEWFGDEANTAFTVADTLDMYDNESKTIDVKLNAMVADDATVTFDTEDTNVVTVNQTTGELTPVAAGAATVEVSVKVGDTTKTADVAVTVIASRTELQVLEAYDFNAKSLADSVSDNNANIIGAAAAASNATPVYVAGRSGNKGDYAAELGTYALKLNSTEVGQKWALSMWMKPTKNTAGNRACCLVGYGDTQEWMALTGANSTKWRFWNNSNDGKGNVERGNSSQMTMNQWNHVVYSQNGSNVDVYINGVKEYSFNDAAPFLDAATDKILVGATYWESDAIFEGLVDDIKVFGHDLSASEVAAVAEEEFVRDAEGLFENTTVSATDKLELVVGGTGEIEVTVDEGVEDVAGIEFASDDHAVVTVTNDGVVTAVGAGRATVTATVKVGAVEKTATTNVLVTAQEMTPEEWFIENGFSVAEAEMKINLDGTDTIEVELNDKIKDVASVEFKAADDTVVSVNEDGVVKALAEGKTSVKVSVTVGTTKKEFTVVVTVANSIAVEYDFSKAVDGKVVDKSGNGNDATIIGNNISFDEETGIMTIDGQDSYLELPMGIIESLSDPEVFTIEVSYARADVADDAAWVYCLGANRSAPEQDGYNYLFYCPRFRWDNNIIRAGIKNGSKTGEKLFKTSIIKPNEEFVTANLVFDNGTIKLYVDGVKVGAANGASELVTNYSIMDDVITPGKVGDVIGFIGGSVWGSDNEFEGQISSFKIYNKAMTDEEVQTADIFREKLEKGLNELMADDSWLGNNASREEVRYNISLPTVYEDSEIVWTASVPTAVSENGIVYNGSEDQEVTLTGTVTNGALVGSVSVDIVVKALDLTGVTAKLAEAQTYVTDDGFTEASRAELQRAIDKVDTDKIASQTEALNVINMLDKAIRKLDVIELFVNPFTEIDASKFNTTQVLSANKSVQLFQVPAKIKDLVTVSYSSSDASVATYANGVITSKAKPGYAVVTTAVTSKYDGFVMYYETLVYVNLDMSSVSVKADANALAVGGKTKVTVSYDNSVKDAGVAVSYSARGAVAVDKSGNITAKRAGEGTVFVKVTAAGKSVRKAVTINVGEITGPSTVKVKKSITLKVKGLPGKVTWKVSNKKIATISSKGKLKAKKAGTVKVTATIGNIKLTKKIKVTKK